MPSKILSSKKKVKKLLFKSNTEPSDLRRKVRVGPWRQKTDFDEVYDWIYGSSSNGETRARACRKLLIWKLRRADLTPASILATLEILSVQVKDTILRSYYDYDDLQIFFANSITRFVNYMSSIMQGNDKKKTMYDTAEALGLNSFTIDLRHLCTHGRSMPSLDILRRTSNYCLDWLKKFYWEPEKELMIDVNSFDIRHKTITDVNVKINHLFRIYDATIEALMHGSETVSQTSQVLADDIFSDLKKLANSLKFNTDLVQFKNALARKIGAVLKGQWRVIDLLQIFLDAFLKMRFFLEGPSIFLNKDDKISNFISHNQILFQFLATYGLIEGLFYALIVICENDSENNAKREGASFWANQIVIGLVVLQEFKLAYKKDRDENRELKLFNLKSFNVESKTARKLYAKINVDVTSTLIFTDTGTRPWSMSLKRSYLFERVKNINRFTKDVLKNCLLLSNPPLTELEFDQITQLINIYVTSSNSEKEELLQNSEKIFTLNDDVLGVKNTEDTTTGEKDKTNEKKIGIWTRVDDAYDWSSCPIGVLPWQNIYLNC